MIVTLIPLIFSFFFINLLVSIFNIFPLLNYRRYWLVYNRFFASVLGYIIDLQKHRKLNLWLYFLSFFSSLLLVIPAWFATNAITKLNTQSTLNFAFIILLAMNLLFLILNTYLAHRYYLFIVHAKRFHSLIFYESWLENWRKLDIDTNDYQHYENFILLLEKHKLSTKNFKKFFIKAQREFLYKEIFHARDYYFLMQKHVLKIALAISVNKTYTLLSQKTRHQLAKALYELFLIELRKTYYRSWYVRNNKLYLS